MAIIRRSFLYYGSAACTGIAGVLHLTLVPNTINFSVNNAAFFLIAGIAQLFWVLPMIKRWGKMWYAIGIAGTVILIGIWVITRVPDNPITGRGGPISEMAVAIATTILLISDRIHREYL